jgi:hypothetical protein
MYSAAQGGRGAVENLMNRKWLPLGGALAVAAVAATSLMQRPAPVSSSAPVAHQADAKPAATTVTFEGARAYDLLKAQCDFGPRPMGTEAHEKTAAWLQEQLKLVTDEVKPQKWNEKIRRGPGAGNTYAFTNVFGIIRGSDDEGKDPQKIVPALMLSAHWDTRPVADMDEVKANRGRPILGANDGASGVAALLEIARVLHANRPRKTIVFAFWDGEDLGEFLHGSTYFARHSREAQWKRFRAQQGILLDMIGDADLRCTRELNSIKYAPQLWEDVHAAAAEVGKSAHFNGRAIEITDDHVPLNQAGIPTIDLIDFDYPYWHTVEDTPDKCSPESLQVIGDVVLHFIARGSKA